MSEENENKPTESHSGFTDSSTDVASTLVQIEELQGKTRLLRWGLFIGVLAIMAIGISSIWSTTKRAAEPAVQVYKEAKLVYEGVQGKINAAQSDYKRIEPKATKAYNTVKGLLNREGEEWKKLQSEFKTEYEKEIKPAAESLAKTVLIDIQGEILKKYDEISAHSDEFLMIASEEYYRLTNNIPEIVKDALEETLQKTIAQREIKMRKMFPKLTKEKQTEVFSRLSNFTAEESEKIFVALFADHLSELGKLQDNMDAIYTKEAEAGLLTNENNGVETTLALLTSIIEIAMREFDTTDHWEGRPKKDLKEKDPEPKEQPPPPAKEKKSEPEKKKTEPKKEDTSSDTQ